MRHRPTLAAALMLVAWGCGGQSQPKAPPKMPTKTPQEVADLLNGLRHFHGSETLYRHWTGALKYTEGVKYLADQAGAQWLVDLVASYQGVPVGDSKLVPAEATGGFQLWTLTVDRQSRSAMAELRADTSSPVLVSQAIEWTDFPLDDAKLYLRNGVLMLPSEY